MVVILVAPYLAYLQVNGGIVHHFDPALRWAARDRQRAPLVLPEFALSPTVFTQPPAGLEPDAEWWLRPPFSGFAANYEPWLFWLLSAVPLASLMLLAAAPDAWRPTWPRARLKLALVAILGGVLNAGFLRGRLAARVGDVAVPNAILLGWMLFVALQATRHGIGPRAERLAVPLRILVGLAASGIVVVTALVLTPSVRESLEKGDVLKGPGYLWRKTGATTGQMKANAHLEAWAVGNYEGPVRLAYYLRDCTHPYDRVLVSPYYPLIAPLAGRPFAGGHVDLRADFFDTPADQSLTISRLERQSVPVAIMAVGPSQVAFEESLPILDDYLRRRYVVAGERDLGGGHRVAVLVDAGVQAVSRYDPLDLPCFR
jgi:hypothetical protein